MNISETDLRELTWSLGGLNRRNRLDRIVSNIRRDYKVDFHSDGHWDNDPTINVVIKAKDQKNPKIVLSAHWDVVPKSLGYADNLTAVSLLLLMQDQFPDNVEILFSDKEEQMSRGVLAYARSENIKQVICNINLDIISIGSYVCFEVYPTTNNRRTLNFIDVMRDEISLRDILWNVSRMFQSQDIPSILLMSSNMPSETCNFNKKISNFCSTIPIRPVVMNYNDVHSTVFAYIHNGKKDNNIHNLNFRTALKIGQLTNRLIQVNSKSVESVAASDL